ncbi:MAG: type III-A CRISPR-associated RAMP protein Csm5 [Clostridiales bacterium]|nr:type III-A CRISPR-associated RAMP protein Csm5 [Clostridiales bacterium]
MDSFLKQYKIKLTALAPVFIGSGQEINKKEYIFDRNLVYVIDSYKLMEAVARRNLTDSYLRFMQGSGKPSQNRNRGYKYENARPVTLKNWLYDNGIRDYERVSAYVLKGAENLDDRRSLKAIQLFIKDAYNKPYIPGSSLKGLLRSIILWNEVGVSNNIPDAKRIKENSSQISARLKNTFDRKEKNKLLLKLAENSNNLEKIFFNREIDKASISIMRGLIISDSRPLSLDDLVLCEKIDYSPDGTKKKPNIVRECIRPGTVIEFDMTIDEGIFSSVRGEGKYTAEVLRKMISQYSKDYYNLITQYFIKGKYEPDTVFFGGGAGYFSKTVSYNLFDRNAAVDFVKNYLSKTTPAVHKHFNDNAVSPHMQKCTSSDGRSYEMGKCKIEIIDSQS